MNNERGMVSMISSIIISLLLLIITTSMVVLMNSELRQATDSDQSIRAFYAAEAGVENAIWNIGRGHYPLGTNRDCGVDSETTAVVGNPAGALSYTCQRVIFNGPLEGSLNKDQADQFDTPTAGNMQSLRVSWNTVSDGTNVAAVPASGFPSGAQWTAQGLPAVMEVTLVRYKIPFLSGAGNDCAGSDSCIKTFVMQPTLTTGFAAARTDYTAANPTSAQPYKASCVTTATNANTGAYQCTFLLANISPGYDYVVRYRPRYAGTHYLLEGFTNPNGGGGKVRIDASSALIDVTAKAGDISRRIVERVRLRSGVANGLDYVVYSEGDVSKDCALSIVADANSDADCTP